jgi:hypothetical protein
MTEIYDCDKGLQMWSVDIPKPRVDPNDDVTWRGCPCGWEHHYEEREHRRRHFEWCFGFKVSGQRLLEVPEPLRAQEVRMVLVHHPDASLAWQKVGCSPRTGCWPSIGRAYAGHVPPNQAAATAFNITVGAAEQRVVLARNEGLLPATEPRRARG